MPDFDPNDISEPEFDMIESIFYAYGYGRADPPVSSNDRMEYAKFFHIAFGEAEVYAWRMSLVDLRFVGETMVMLRTVADEMFQQDEGYLWFYRMAYDIRHARSLDIEFNISIDRVYTLLLSPLAAVGGRITEDALRKLDSAVNSIGYIPMRKLLMDRVPLSVLTSIHSARVDASLIDSLVDGA